MLPKLWAGTVQFCETKVWGDTGNYAVIWMVNDVDEGLTQYSERVPTMVAATTRIVVDHPPQRRITVAPVIPALSHTALLAKLPSMVAHHQPQ